MRRILLLHPLRVHWCPSRHFTNAAKCAKVIKATGWPLQSESRNSGGNIKGHNHSRRRPLGDLSSHVAYTSFNIFKAETQDCALKESERDKSSASTESFWRGIMQGCGMSVKPSSHTSNNGDKGPPVLKFLAAGNSRILLTPKSARTS